MIKLEIHCPVHGKTETIELPDSYLGPGDRNSFDGEVLCTGQESPTDIVARLRIKAVIRRDGHHLVSSVTVA